MLATLADARALPRSALMSSADTSLGFLGLPVASLTCKDEGTICWDFSFDRGGGCCDDLGCRRYDPFFPLVRSLSRALPVVGAMAHHPTGTMPAVIQARPAVAFWLTGLAFRPLTLMSL